MLIKDSITALQYAQFVGTINFNSIKPTVEMIESVYIENILGTTLYNNLDAALAAVTADTPVPLTDDNAKLLEKCRLVIGRYLCYHYAPIAEIQVSESGARRSENSTSKTAFQYQVTNFRTENLNQAELYTEKLLQFLEDNQTTYSDWTSSDSYKQYNQLFIKTAKDFDYNYKTAAPYRNYWALRWKMQDVEDQQIRDLLGDDCYNDIKTKNADNAYTWTDDEKRLVDMLKKGISYLSVAFSIPHLGVRIDAMGITVAGQTTSSNDDSTKRISAMDSKVSLLITTSENAGRTWLKRAYDFLVKNAASFPLFVPPTTGTAPDGNVEDPYKNDVNNIYYPDDVRNRNTKTNPGGFNANLGGGFGLP